MILTIEDYDNYLGDHYVCGQGMTSKEVNAVCVSMVIHPSISNNLFLFYSCKGQRGWSNLRRVPPPSDAEAFVDNFQCDTRNSSIEDGCTYTITDTCDQVAAITCEVKILQILSTETIKYF